MEENRIFAYAYRGMWLYPNRSVEVLETTDGGNIQCHENREKSLRIEIDPADIISIKNLMLRHSKIFDYKELESNCVYDGTCNDFFFAPKRDKTIHLMAFNIWAVKEPDIENYYKHYPEPPEGCYPYKSIEVVALFDDIAVILRKNGVPERFLKL